MARLPRLYAPSVPQLVQACFARPLAHAHDPTPAASLDTLREWLALEATLHHVAIHCWVIVPDRILLIATPPDSAALPRLMQGLGRRMAAGLVHGRVFEGRYRSTLIENSWVSAGMVWAESLPVRQGLVDTAARWPWSSAREHLGLQPPGGMLQHHADYWMLGDTPFARQAAYRARLQAGTTEARCRRIEQALHGQWALGSAEFIAQLTPQCSRRAAPAPRGRPRNPPAA